MLPDVSSTSTETTPPVARPSPSTVAVIATQPTVTAPLSSVQNAVIGAAVALASAARDL